MKKKIFLIGIILILLLIVTGVSFYLINNSKVYKEDDNPSVTNAIVMEDKEGLYTIYNLEGEQITDIKYEYVSDFYNKHAVVKNQNNEYGIINDKGKMSVNFGKYYYISEEKGLYKVEDKDFKEFLIDSKGKVICDLEKKEIDTFYSIEMVVVKSYDKINVFNHMGKTLLNLDYNSNEEYSVYNEGERYATFFYNNTSYIIDLYKGKITNTIFSSVPYYVSSVNTLDGEKYVIASNDEKNKEYIYMNNSKEIFRTNTCTNLFFENHNPNLILAKSDGNRYIVDENGNELLEIHQTDLEYIDSKNYIIEEKFQTTNFYTDSKLLKTIENTEPYITASIIQRIYILKNLGSTNNKTYSYYSVNGEKIINIDYKKASEFDKNNIACVSENGKTFYLINLKGQKISNEYDSIEHSVDFSNQNVYIAKIGDTNYVLNNLGKEILSTKGTIEKEDNYFFVKENGKYTYYTFDGKEFYNSN